MKIAAQLWPLDQIADGYERLLDVATARLHKLQNSPGTDACHDDHRTRGGIHASHGTGSAVAAGTTAHQLGSARGLGRSLRSAGRFLAQVDGADELPSAVPPVRRCNR